MSVQDEINRIAAAKADIASALEEKGVSVAEGTSLDEMGDMVRSIPTGGEANVIESVSVNSIPLPITNKNVNIDLSSYLKYNENYVVGTDYLSISFKTANIEAYTDLTLIGITATLRNFTGNSYVTVWDDDNINVYAPNGVTIEGKTDILGDTNVEGTLSIDGELAATQEWVKNNKTLGEQYKWSEDLINNQTDLSGATIKFNTETTIESLDLYSWKLFISDTGYYLHGDSDSGRLRLYDKNGNIIEPICESGDGWLKDSLTLPSDFGYITRFGSTGVEPGISFSLNVLNTIAPDGTDLSETIATETYADTVSSTNASTALSQANSYTDEKIKEVNNRVTLLTSNLGDEIDNVASELQTYTDTQISNITNGWKTISYTTTTLYTSGATSPTISLTNLTVKANPRLRLISVGGRVTVNTTSAWTTTPGFYFNTTPLKNVIGSMPSATFVAPITCTLNGALETEMAYIQLNSSQFRVMQYESAANHRTAGKRIYYLNAMIPY